MSHTCLWMCICISHADMSHACLWMQNEPYVSVDVYMHQSCRHEPCMSVDAEQNEPYVSVDVYMHQSCRHEPCMSVDAE